MNINKKQEHYFYNKPVKLNKKPFDLDKFNVDYLKTRKLNQIKYNFDYSYEKAIKANFDIFA